MDRLSPERSETSSRPGCNAALSLDERVEAVERKLDDLIRAFARLTERVEGVVETHHLWDGS